MIEEKAETGRREERDGEGNGRKNLTPTVISKSWRKWQIYGPFRLLFRSSQANSVITILVRDIFIFLIHDLLFLPIFTMESRVS